MRGIVITTSPNTKEWLHDCIASVIDSDYEILIVQNNRPDLADKTDTYEYTFTKDSGEVVSIKSVWNDWNGFELGGILRGAEYFDEFIHLMDTCVIKKPEMLEMMFDHDGGVHLCPDFFSYLGKYRSSVIEQIGVPKISTKEDAIRFEREWNAKYLKVDTQTKQFEPVLPIHTDVFEEKHGRKNMILNNGFIIKYKATWSL